MKTQVLPTILIVDDSRAIRAMFLDLLSDHGFNVVQARDGMEALEKIASVPPDLIIVDIVMPRMNGYELCRKLRDNPQTRALPILMVSSKSQEFDRYWGLKQGADAYIVRPCKPEELLNTVRGLLERGSQQIQKA